MIKAATLYVVIIISLLMAMISISLLSVAFYYRLGNLKKARFDKLSSNMESGLSILLSADYITYDEDLLIDLYEEEKDSILLNKIKWGAFDLNTIKSFELKDTLKRSFLSAVTYTDGTAVYLADEDRPLSVSGETRITGDGELPKSGLKKAYVDGKPYSGKELIRGKIKDSARELPPVDEKRIEELLSYFIITDNGLRYNDKDSIVNSFFNDRKLYKLKIDHEQLSGQKIKGKVVLVSDTTLTLSADLILEDALVFAPGIIVKEGFKGSCQLFARDSISIGKNCNFLYPSFAGVFKTDTSKIQSKVALGENTHFAGILMSYEKKRSELQTIISLAKNCIVTGEVYATGYLKLESPLSVYGKVYAKTFVMEKGTTLYENFLIDIVVNRKLLSKYYLSSPLFKREAQNYEVLKWLN